MKNRTKQEIINTICQLASIPKFTVSNGSTEPREFLEAIAEQLGLGRLVVGLDKPGIGKCVLESFGRPWLPEFDSAGSTITREGLLAIENLLEDLLREID